MTFEYSLPIEVAIDLFFVRTLISTFEVTRFPAFESLYQNVYGYYFFHCLVFTKKEIIFLRKELSRHLPKSVLWRALPHVEQPKKLLLQMESQLRRLY